MIKTFKSKSLAELFRMGKTAKLDKRLAKRVFIRLDFLDRAIAAEDMDIIGFNFHSLKGFVPVRYYSSR